MPDKRVNKGMISAIPKKSKLADNIVKNNNIDNFKISLRSNGYKIFFINSLKLFFYIKNIIT